MSLDVLGLGAMAMDVVLNCSALPGEDGFALVQGERLVPGGSCANVMAAVRTLGFSSGLVGKVGDDDFGRAFLQDLKARGIDSSRVMIKPGGVTLHTYVMVAGSGARSICVHVGDSLLDLSAKEVSARMVEEIRIFYTDHMPAEPSFRLARECRERGVKVVFDLEVPVDFHRLCGTGPEKIEEMIGLSDLFVTGTEALAQLTGRDEPESGLRDLCARYALADGAVATLGERGSLWFQDGELLARPSLRVKAVDTTGAGDAFVAGLMAGYFLEDKDRKAALDWATACAALKCTQAGPRLQGGKDDVERILGEQMK